MTVTTLSQIVGILTETKPKHKFIAPDKAENYNTERKGEKNRE